MFRKIIKIACLSAVLIYSGHICASPKVKGIYINQGTLENASMMNNLIQQSKAVGINTFVIDLEKVTPNYQKRVQEVKDNGIRYVARVVVFPDGGKETQLKSPAYWESRFKLVKKAIDFGADEIQLDYIRYSSKQPPSPQNAKDVKQVITWFKNKIAPYHVPMQIDIFGEVSFKESPRIGQNIQLFADTIDSACPMVYPSHYHPFQKHSKQPYQIVYKSLTSLKGQFADNKTPFKLIPYIEASNYHYKMSDYQRSVYVLSQIKAVEDANADGWFVWSAKNHYGSLFNALKNRNTFSNKIMQPMVP